MKDIDDIRRHAVMTVFADAECCADDTLWFNDCSTLLEEVLDVFGRSVFDLVLADQIAQAERVCFWREPV